MSEELERIRIAVERTASDIAIIKQMLAKVVNYMVEAESEVSEKMRRFIMYMHDVHDVVNMYEERGHQVPRYILAEMERCDDRYRQLLDKAHTDGGVFEKVRREMADDPLNRWDHTRLLGKEKKNESGNETRPPDLEAG
jgi:hypothetical protein